MAAKRILVVEDDDHVAQGLLWALKLSGFEAEGCDSAEAALLRLEASPCDLVVSDLRLPGMTGQELLARIADCHPQVRTILITGFGSAEVQAWAAAHASAYLAKPFGAGQLVQTIDRILAATDRMPEDNPQANPDTVSPEGSAP
jgi:two-component system C4-dicarboxylate transport response regulator DctD